MFEIITETGRPATVGGGGRYDNLVSECGGPPTPAVGFSSGIERLLMALSAKGIDRTGAVRPDVMVVGTDRLATAVLAARLRRNFRVEVDLMERSFGSQMKQADRLAARFALILGDDELAGNYATLRNMTAGTESRIPRNRLDAELALRLTNLMPDAAPKET